MQVVSDWPDFDHEAGTFLEMMRVSGRPLSVSLASARGYAHRAVLDLLTAANEEGLRMRAQVPARGIGVLIGLQATVNPLMGSPTFRSIDAPSLAERVAVLRDPELRAQIIADVAEHPGGRTMGMLESVFELGDPPDYEPDPANSIAARAGRDGVDPLELLYDLMLGDNGEALLYWPILNYAERQPRRRRELLAHPYTVPGLSDGGAHVGTICDASFPTTLLSYWGRDRPHGVRFEPEWLVQQQCRATAETVGLLDRGIVAPGFKADLNVIDFEHLGMHAPRLVFDLPAGGKRLLQQSTGYLHTFVSGVEVCRNGESTGATPGRLVRGAQPSSVITDEAIAQLRARVGVAEPHPMPPHYLRPGTDAFRHVAMAYGDDNPLWCDPAYGVKTRWDGPIAPPPLVGGDTLIGEDEVTEVEPSKRDLMKGDPLRGVHAFYSASAREWWAPLVPDQRVFRRNALVGVLDKPSEFAERAVHEWTAQVFRDEVGTLLAGQYRLMIRTERSKAREKKKYDAITIDRYDDDAIADIDAQYAAERPRGAEPRWFEDVHEGDEIGPMVKGPLTVTDMICWHVGMGMGLYGVQPLRLGARNRARIPRFFHRDDLNVPDVMQRVHWDPEFARRSGNPTTFDYGRMRETWLIHLCTDWMGDDAWLWKLDCEFRKFNYVGDTQWLRGTVTPRIWRRAIGRRSTSSSRPRTSGASSPRRGTRRSCCRAASGARCDLPDPPGGATGPSGRARRDRREVRALVTDHLRITTRRVSCASISTSRPSATRSTTT